MALKVEQEYISGKAKKKKLRLFLNVCIFQTKQTLSFYFVPNIELEMYGFPTVSSPWFDFL